MSRAVVAAVLAACVALLALAKGPRVQAWRLLGVPAMEPAFSDTHVLTAALDARRAGVDPLFTALPGGVQYNYPRGWLLLRFLGLGDAQRTGLACALALLFWAAALLVLGKGSAREGLWHTAALSSPVALVAVERGNLDLLIFALVAAAVLLPGWPRRALLMAGALLKLYPAFAFSLDRRRLWLAAAFLAWVALSWSDLLQIAHVTGSSPHFSYGRRVLFDALSEQLHRPLPAEALSWVLAALGAAAAALWSRRLQFTATPAFLAGASIFTGSFLLGSNWNYRLIFLLFTLPQLLGGRRELVALVLLVLWLPGLPVWFPGAGRVTVPLGLLGTFVLYVWLGALLFASARIRRVEAASIMAA